MFLKRKRTPQPPASIEFREPPPPQRKPRTPADPKQPERGKVADFVREIAWRKGEWAVYRSGLNSNSASAYVSIYRKKFPHTEWVARLDHDGLYTVFVRVLHV